MATPFCWERFNDFLGKKKVGGLCKPAYCALCLEACYNWPKFKCQTLSGTEKISSFNKKKFLGEIFFGREAFLWKKKFFVFCLKHNNFGR